jgi:hypothetical protein
LAPSFPLDSEFQAVLITRLPLAGMPQGNVRETVLNRRGRVQVQRVKN